MGDESRASISGEYLESGRVGVPAAGGIILKTVDSRFGVSAGFLRCPECSRWMRCGEQGGTSSGALYSIWYGGGDLLGCRKGTVGSHGGGFGNIVGSGMGAWRSLKFGFLAMWGFPGHSTIFSSSSEFSAVFSSVFPPSGFSISNCVTNSIMCSTFVTFLHLQWSGHKVVPWGGGGFFLIFFIS